MPRRHRAHSIRSRRSRNLWKEELLGELIRKHPRVLKVLHAHGVHFCAGCYLTLFAPLEKAAAYHAVTDRKGFFRDMNRAIR